MTAYFNEKLRVTEITINGVYVKRGKCTKSYLIPKIAPKTEYDLVRFNKYLGLLS